MVLQKPGQRRRHFQQIPAKGLSRSSRLSPSTAFRIGGRHSLQSADTETKCSFKIMKSSIAWYRMLDAFER
jgi:hypothetical protein